MFEKCFSFGDMFGFLLAAALLFFLLGTLFGLVLDLKVRKRNRRMFDAGGFERMSMLDRPEKTGTKCGQPLCRLDPKMSVFFKEQARFQGLKE